MADYLIHKACEVSKLYKGINPNLEADYIAQAKYDGCNLIVVVDLASDKIDAWSRTGEVVLSCDHIKAALLTFPGIKSGAYLGEAWAPDMEFNEISGVFRRQYSDERSCRLQFAVFDFIPLPDWISGACDIGWADRMELLPPHMRFVEQAKNPLWLAAMYGYLAETFPNTNAQKFCDEMVAAGGYDGAIFRHPDGKWVRNDVGKGGQIIKVKAKLSFTLRVTGIELGKGRNAGRVGALVVDFKGKSLSVGSGLTDKQRDAWHDDVHQSEGYIIGKLVEVEAMGYSSEGLLREPRFKGIRDDAEVDNG